MAKWLLLIILASFDYNVAEACQPVMDGKPLISAIASNKNHDVIKIFQPQFELRYIDSKNPSHILDTPMPADTFEVISIAEISGDLCVYPTYQYYEEQSISTAALEKLKQQFTYEYLPPVAFFKELAEAAILWSSPLEKNRFAAAKKYLALSNAISQENKDLKQESWIAAITGFFKLGEYAVVIESTSLDILKKLTSRLKIKAVFLLVRAKLADKFDEVALVNLNFIEQLKKTGSLSLNDEIELNLLYSSAYFSLGKLKQGRQRLEKISELISKPSAVANASKNLLAGFFDNYGHLYVVRSRASGANRSEELSKGLNYEYKALTIAKLSGNISLQVQVTTNIATMYRSAWQFDNAIRNFNIALSLLENHSDRIAEVYVYKNLGSTYMSIGAYDKALIYLEAAQLRAEDITPYWMAKIRCDLGTVKRNLRDLAGAIQDHKSCVRSFRLLQSSEPSKQVQAGLIDGLVELEKSKKALDRPPDQLSFELIKINGPIVEDYNVRVNALLWLASSQSNQKDAKSYFHQALEASQFTSNPILRLTAPIEFAQFLLSSGDVLAQSTIMSALQRIEHTFSELDAEELAPSWSHKINEFINSLVQKHIHSNELVDAFNLFERSRANSLRRTTILMKRSNTEEGMLGNRLSKLSKLSVLLTSNSNTYNTKIDHAIQKDLLRLSKIHSNTDPMLSELKWFRLNQQNLIKIPEPLPLALTLPVIQSSLKEEQLLFNYFRANGELSVFIVGKRHFSLQKLGSYQDISPLIDSAVMAVSNPNKDPYEILVKLSKKLLPESSILNNSNELFIIPQGKLNTVPFSALVLNTEKQTLKPLIYTHSITQIPSFTSFSKRTQKDAKQHNANFVMFGDPLIKFTPQGQQNDTHLTEGKPWLHSLPSLPWTRFESEKLTEIYSDKRTFLFLKERATRENLMKEQVRNSKILHIATHNYFDQNNPQNVGFTLSVKDEKGNIDPGFVAYSELFSYQFGNDLVMMNGCASAMGRTLNGEGLQGMARGFLVNGAENVIATLWPILDKASSEFAINFYQNLQHSRNYSKALQTAQKSFASNPRFRHPFYWAGYTLYSLDSKNYGLSLPQ